MHKTGKITLPSSFINILDELDENISVEDIEQRIIEHAVSMFDAKWGSIKYYYGNQFVSGYSSVPQNLRLKPRKRGFMFKTIEHNHPHLMTEKILREAHPEADPSLKSILLAPLRMDDTTVATVSLVDTKDRTLTKKDTQLLSDFGTVYGRLLKMAHAFAAENNAAKNRTNFMSFAAHELKNPLMAISSYAQLIKKNATKNNELKIEWLDKISTEVSRMTSLINELLDIKQSSNGDFTYKNEELSLKHLLSQVCENFRVRNAARELVVKYELADTATKIIGDEIKLTQVFINLLNNAHKFSEPNTSIILHIAEDDKNVSIAVIDQGMGIAVEEVPFIFNEFYRGTNGNKKKGIGIGLFLVKSIIDSHNGTIKVESRLGEGTTFTVILPKHIK
jgi:signal transduction histidine kinase